MQSVLIIQCFICKVSFCAVLYMQSEQPGRAGDNLGAKEGSSSKDYGFSLVLGQDREFYLAAENDRDKQEWIEFLQHKIASATSRKGGASTGLKCAAGV